MRISVYKDDPGYAIYRVMHRAGRVDVFLDGRRVRDCVTADSKTGWVTVYERDGEGNLVLNSKSDGVKRKRMRGLVEIRRAL